MDDDDSIIDIKPAVQNKSGSKGSNSNSQGSIENVAMQEIADLEDN